MTLFSLSCIFRLIGAYMHLQFSYADISQVNDCSSQLLTCYIMLCLSRNNAVVHKLHEDWQLFLAAELNWSLKPYIYGSCADSQIDKLLFNLGIKASPNLPWFASNPLCGKLKESFCCFSGDLCWWNLHRWEYQWALMWWATKRAICCILPGVCLFLFLVVFSSMLFY